MEIKLLHFSGCPHAPMALRRLTGLLVSEGVSASIRQIEVLTIDQAKETRFLGSPSIRIDGDDIEPKARGRLDFGLMCRTYEDGSGVPPLDLITKAIREHSTAD